jgi:hypothetical protein
MYTLYYQLNAPDCDPEFLRNVNSLKEAWDFVTKQAMHEHLINPNNEPHPDTYHKFKNRAEMKQANANRISDNEKSNKREDPELIRAAFFEMPLEIEEDEERLICVSDDNMYFVSHKSHQINNI